LNKSGHVSQVAGAAADIADIDIHLITHRFLVNTVSTGRKSWLKQPSRIRLQHKSIQPLGWGVARENLIACQPLQQFVTV
jgi:hypothetical protein